MTETNARELNTAGFNRYMVECESTKSYAGDADTTGFNRYMVECEYL